MANARCRQIVVHGMLVRQGIILSKEFLFAEPMDEFFGISQRVALFVP